MMAAAPAKALAPPILATDSGGAVTQGGWARGSVPPSWRLTLNGAEVALVNGRFLIGFDRDCGPQASLVAIGPQGMRVDRGLTIAPRAWRIEHVDAPFHPPSMPEGEYARIRAEEVARMDAARAHDTGAQGWRQDFAWPVKGRVSGLFGSQRVYQGGIAGAYHSGLDIAPGAGAVYAAPADGVVVLAAASPFTLEGNLLMVDHGMGLNSAFLHARRLLVREGDRVVQGQPLGEVGMSGRATGPHLHWSLRWRDARLDPLLMLQPRSEA